MPEDFNFSLEEIGNKADHISSELQELEDLLRKGGIELENNICLSKKGKSVVFPKGYVRKVKDLQQKYRLDSFSDQTLAKNIAYYLQATDLISYLLNRTTLADNRSLSVGAAFRKMAIIWNAAIVEGMLAGKIETVSCICCNCGNLSTSKCKASSKNALSKRKSSIERFANRMSFPVLSYSINLLSELRVIDSQYRSALDWLRDFRNHIHLQYVDENHKIRNRDFVEEKYTISEYNRSVRILRKLPEVFAEIDSVCDNFKT